MVNLRNLEIFVGLGLGMAISCSDAKFTCSTGAKKSFNKKIQANADASKDQDSEPGGAIDNSLPNLSEVNFLFGPKNSPSDFLFVMDNSVSMETVLKPTLNGLLKLGSADCRAALRLVSSQLCQVELVIILESTKM